MKLDAIVEAAAVIREADALLVSAGAGIGVDSGLPDFRGNEGFWRAYPPIRALGISFMEMANPQWFDRNPSLAWAFYGHRLNLYRRTIPHVGFSRLLEIGRSKSGGAFVFTSNVDGQFQKAGFDPERIEECHGSIHHLQCTTPCTDAIWDASDIDVTVDEESFQALAPLPSCPHCGGLARPNVLMFGDWGWVPNRTASQGHRLAAWIRETAETGRRLVVVELGAGLAVPTVRYQSEEAARALGGTLVRINPRDHQVPPGHLSIPLGAEEGTRKIIELI